jgi:hypothetical protein
LQIAPQIYDNSIKKVMLIVDSKIGGAASDKGE